MSHIPVSVTHAATLTEFHGDYMALNPERSLMAVTDEGDGVYLYNYPAMTNVNGAGNVHIAPTDADSLVHGITCDASGNWYFAEDYDDGVTAQQRIRTFNGTSTSVSTWASRSVSLTGINVQQPVWHPTEDCILATTYDVFGVVTDKLLRITSSGYTELFDLGAVLRSSLPIVDEAGAVWWARRASAGSASHVVARHVPGSGSITTSASYAATTGINHPVGAPDGLYDNTESSGNVDSDAWRRATWNGSSIDTATETDLTNVVRIGPTWFALDQSMSVLLEYKDRNATAAREYWVWEVEWAAAASWIVGGVGSGGDWQAGWR